MYSAGLGWRRRSEQPNAQELPAIVLRAGHPGHLKPSHRTMPASFPPSDLTITLSLTGCVAEIYACGVADLVRDQHSLRTSTGSRPTYSRWVSWACSRCPSSRMPSVCPTTRYMTWHSHSHERERATLLTRACVYRVCRQWWAPPHLNPPSPRRSTSASPGSSGQRVHSEDQIISAQTSSASLLCRPPLAHRLMNLFQLSSFWPGDRSRASEQEDDMRVCAVFTRLRGRTKS
jgi:hypothetical protein